VQEDPPRPVSPDTPAGPDADPGRDVSAADVTRLTETVVGHLTDQARRTASAARARRVVDSDGEPGVLDLTPLRELLSELVEELGKLFVSNAHNVGAGTGTISAFSDSANGTLSSIGASPFADLQTAPCWVEITHDGQFLFTVNTGSGEISRYSIAQGGGLTLLGSTPVGATGGVGAVDARLGPDGGILWVDESRVGAVGAFAVNGGNLTELPSSPTSLPAGAAPAGIVVN
jgi:Lactonase, 7-bladed beta-propeller